MRKYNRNFGFILAFIGLIICAFHVFTFYRFVREQLVFDRFSIVVFTISIILFLSSFAERGYYIYLFCLFGSILFSFYNDPNNGIGIILILLALLVSHRNDMLDERTNLKMGTAFIVIIISIATSIIHEKNSLLYSLPVLVLMFVLAVLTYIRYKLNLNLDLLGNKKLNKEIVYLKGSLKEVEESLDLIRNDYIDPVEAGLTKAELKLLETLCVYKESNQDTAKRLGKSVNTIKVQLKKIMDKIGAENRYQLIDLCKKYYIKI